MFVCMFFFLGFVKSIIFACFYDYCYYYKISPSLRRGSPFFFLSPPSFCLFLFLLFYYIQGSFFGSKESTFAIDIYIYPFLLSVVFFPEKKTITPAFIIDELVKT